MAAPLRILPSQANDLAAVCSIGSEALALVATRISTADLTIKRERIEEIVSSIVLEPSSAKLLCRVVFGLSAVTSRDASKMAETVDGLTLTLRSDFTNDDRFVLWEEVSAALLNILECESVYLAAKAVDISYDFERILTDCRILTSVRPVFTNARDRIVGNTIVQTLRLEYLTSGGRKESTSVALDLTDIGDLQKACKEAVEKARIARREFEGDSRRETVMLGEGAEA